MARVAGPKQVEFFQDENGETPFVTWLDGLRDAKTRRRILIRLRRLEQGNFGDCKSVGDGLSELRLFFGPGYRIYFGETGGTLVVILSGGDKASQPKDIKRAKALWKEYLEQ
jgi:putative addiction module killer protein